jgi:hypothetical protein
MSDTDDVIQAVIIRFPSHYFRASRSLNMLLSVSGYDTRVSSRYSPYSIWLSTFLDTYGTRPLFVIYCPRSTVELHPLYPHVCQFQPNDRPKLCAMWQLMSSYSTLPDIQVFRHVTPCRLLTFKNLASYIQDGSTATLQMLHFIYFSSTNISTEYFKHAAHSLSVFLFKMPFIL